MSIVHETLTIANRDFHFKWNCPGQWNDLDAWQLRRIISLQHLGLSRLKFQTYAVPILLKIRFNLVKQFVIGKTMNPEYLLLADFLLDDEQYLTKNLIGKYRGLKTVSRWQDMVAKQYFIAEGYLDIFRQTQDPEYLDKFMCAFYAPMNQDFSEVDEDINYTLFKKWPLDVKYCIVAFYLGSRKDFQSNPNYKSSFKSNGKGGNQNVANALMKLRSQMSGNDLTKAKAIDGIPLPEFLFQYNKDLEDAERQTQQLVTRNK